MLLKYVRLSPKVVEIVLRSPTLKHPHLLYSLPTLSARLAEDRLMIFDKQTSAHNITLTFAET